MVDDEVSGDVGVDVEVEGCCVVVVVAGGTLPPLDCEEMSGMGVLAMLCWPDCWPPGRDASRDLGTGGMYVWPYEAEKMGKGDATERAFVREVTVESYNDSLSVMLLTNKEEKGAGYFSYNIPSGSPQSSKPTAPYRPNPPRQNTSREPESHHHLPQPPIPIPSASSAPVSESPTHSTAPAVAFAVVSRPPPQRP